MQKLCSKANINLLFLQILMYFLLF